MELPRLLYERPDPSRFRSGVWKHWGWGSHLWRRSEVLPTGRSGSTPRRRHDESGPTRVVGTHSPTPVGRSGVGSILVSEILHSALLSKRIFEGSSKITRRFQLLVPESHGLTTSGVYDLGYTCQKPKHNPIIREHCNNQWYMTPGLYTIRDNI